MTGRRALALMILAGLGGCVAPRATSVTDRGAWLTGSWLGSDQRFPGACDSDAPIRFGADGRYVTYGETGRWRIERDMLVTQGGSGGENRARIERVGADRIALTGATGRSELRRCP